MKWFFCEMENAWVFIQLKYGMTFLIIANNAILHSKTTLEFFSDDIVKQRHQLKKKDYGPQSPRSKFISLESSR